MEQSQRRKMLLNRCVGHADGRQGVLRGPSNEVAQISSDRFLTNLVCLLTVHAEKSKVSLQVAPVRIQCVESQTAAGLKAKPCTGVWLRSNKWDTVPSNVADELIGVQSVASWA